MRYNGTKIAPTMLPTQIQYFGLDSIVRFTIRLSVQKVLSKVNYMASQDSKNHKLV